MKGINPTPSPESRAVARALVAMRKAPPKFSLADEDALILYWGAHYLDASMSPDSRVLEGTAAYQRGRDLQAQFGRKPTAYHLDEHAKRSTAASLEFELFRGREPGAGDVLRMNDLKTVQAAKAANVQRFVEAWQRRIPNLACPVKVVDGRVYQHLREGQTHPPHLRSGGWQEDWRYSPEVVWQQIMRAVNGDAVRDANAVKFDGVVGGEHQCTAVKADESV